MQAMTQAEYARHRGVSRQAIGKVISKLPDSAFVIQRGKRLINAAAADDALGEVRERVGLSDDDENHDADPTFGSAAGVVRGRQGGEGVAALTRVRTGKELYLLEAAKIDHAKLVGKLLLTEDVTRAMEICAVAIVREIDQLPMFAEEIAAAMTRDGVQGVRAFLKEVARKVRASLEKTMRLIDQSETKQGEASS